MHTTIDKLPSGVMVHDFLELPDRIRSVSSSKLLQKLIFQECSPLWRDIDFGALEYESKVALTDDALSSLLVRVSAKTVTRSLNLNYCHSIKGTGLKPLSGSKVLEKLSAQQGHSVSLDQGAVIATLRTMFPFNLFHVFLNKTHRPPLPVFLDFIRDFRAARLQRARDQHIVCSACHEPVVNDSRQLVANNSSGIPLTECGTCRLDFCRHGSCRIGMVDCDCCGVASCGTCENIGQCCQCQNSYCENCDTIYSCDDCPDGSGLSCNGCSKTLCGDCDETRGGSFRYCDSCSEMFCWDCRQVIFCPACDMNLCVQCGNFNFLYCCGEMVCEQCVDPYQ